MTKTQELRIKYTVDYLMADFLDCDNKTEADIECIKEWIKEETLSLATKITNNCKTV